MDLVLASEEFFASPEWGLGVFTLGGGSGGYFHNKFKKIVEPRVRNNR